MIFFKYGSAILGILVGLLLTPPVSAENPRVLVQTTLGKFEVELFVQQAPITVANFLRYVQDSRYDGTIFHRVISGFMIQGGGYSPDFTELEEIERIHNEADNGINNGAGTIAMARMNQIDSAGRQFFINVVDNPRLDHQKDSCTREQESQVMQARQKGLFKPMSCASFGYAVFGAVVSGMDVVNRIEVVETGQQGSFGDVPLVPIVVESMKLLPLVSGR